MLTNCTRHSNGDILNSVDYGRGLLSFNKVTRNKFRMID